MQCDEKLKAPSAPFANRKARPNRLGVRSSEGTWIHNTPPQAPFQVLTGIHKQMRRFEDINGSWT